MELNERKEHFDNNKYDELDVMRHSVALEHVSRLLTKWLRGFRGAPLNEWIARAFRKSLQNEFKQMHLKSESH